MAHKTENGQFYQSGFRFLLLIIRNIGVKSDLNLEIIRDVKFMTAGKDFSVQSLKV